MTEDDRFKEVLKGSSLEAARLLQEFLEQGKIDEAKKGLALLTEDIQDNLEFELTELLEELLEYIIRWVHFKEKRCLQWMFAIQAKKGLLSIILEGEPSYDENFLLAKWDMYLDHAYQTVEHEMETEIERRELSWEEVTHKAYDLD